MSIDDEWGAGEQDAGKLESNDLAAARELAYGTSLRALAEGKLLDQPRALAIVRGVLEAVAGRGAVHGDIKPESILITGHAPNERVKLLDATKSEDARYRAPEAALGAIDHRADIYSITAVLFELLTGHPPFYADDANALRRLHAYAPLQTLQQRAPDLAFVAELEDHRDRAREETRGAVSDGT